MTPRLRRTLTIMASVMVATTGCGQRAPGPDAVVGVDSDGDGVRDDVAAHIATYDPELHEYLRRVAANEQKVVTFDGDTADAYPIAVEANRLVTCIPEALDPDAARDAAASVREQVADTGARQANQREFTAAISGQTFPEPDCDAEPEASVPAPDTADA